MFTSSYFRISSSAPESSPLNLKGYNTSFTSIYIEWDRPGSRIPGILQGYIVQHTRLHPAGEISQNVTVNSTTTSYEIQGLMSCTRYSIRVLAFTSFAGPFSQAIVVSTEDKLLPRAYCSICFTIPQQDCTYK